MADEENVPRAVRRPSCWDVGEAEFVVGFGRDSSAVYHSTLWKYELEMFALSDPRIVPVSGCSFEAYRFPTDVVLMNCVQEEPRMQYNDE